MFKNQSFDCHFNNRMTIVDEKREFIPTKLRHSEIVDGKRVWIDGPKLNPFKDIDGDSLSLRSRIESGTFENHEGSVLQSEKAQGSDFLTKQIEAAERQYAQRKSDFEKRLSDSRFKKIVNDALHPVELNKD